MWKLFFFVHPKDFISVQYLPDTLEVDTRLDFVASLISWSFCLVPILPSCKLQCADWDNPISFRETKFVLKNINCIIEMIWHGKSVTCLNIKWSFSGNINELC